MTATEMRRTHVLVVVASGGAPVEWAALRRDAGEREALISMLWMDGDRARTLLPAIDATHAPRDLAVPPSETPAEADAWNGVVDAVYTVRAAVPSVDATSIVLLGDARAGATVRDLLAADPSVAVEVRSLPSPRPVARPAARTAPRPASRPAPRTVPRPVVASDPEDALPREVRWSSSAVPVDSDTVWDAAAARKADRWPTILSVGAGVLAGVFLWVLLAESTPPVVSAGGALVAALAVALALAFVFRVLDPGMFTHAGTRAQLRAAARTGQRGDVALAKSLRHGEFVVLLHPGGTLHEWRRDAPDERWSGAWEVRAVRDRVGSTRARQVELRLRIGDYLTRFCVVTKNGLPIDDMLHGREYAHGSSTAAVTVRGRGDLARLQADLLDLAAGRRR